MLHSMSKPLNHTILNTMSSTNITFLTLYIDTKPYNHKNQHNQPTQQKAYVGFLALFLAITNITT